jgi:hypothetical protein
MSSDDAMLDKMDALLKKHRGSHEADPALPSATPGSPPPGWLPVLTDVIERGTPQARPVLPVAASAAATATPAATEPAVNAVADPALTEQLIRELAPRLSEVMEKQVAAELRRNLDQTVSTLLSQLDVNMREIVRDAVAEKLKPPHDPST